MKTALIRRGHRWLGVFIGIQLLLWSASGVFFAWTDLDEVHGDPNRATPDPVTVGHDWVSLSRVELPNQPPGRPLSLDDLSLVRISDRVFYRLVTEDGGVSLADATTGELRPPLRREEAVALARTSFLPDAEVARVELVTEDDVGPHHEYRGSALPAWRVEFEHESGTRVYVDQRGGEVTKHRNQIWRGFDFFWMLHTMDYRGRDDFNNPLLRGVSALAVVTVLSGFLLWWRTSRWRRRQS